MYLLFFSSLPYLVYLLHEIPRTTIKYPGHGSTYMNIGYLILRVAMGDCGVFTYRVSWDS